MGAEIPLTLWRCVWGSGNARERWLRRGGRRVAVDGESLSDSAFRHKLTQRRSNTVQVRASAGGSSLARGDDSVKQRLWGAYAGGATLEVAEHQQRWRRRRSRQKSTTSSSSLSDGALPCCPVLASWLCAGQLVSPQRRSELWQYTSISGGSWQRTLASPCALLFAPATPSRETHRVPEAAAGLTGGGRRRDTDN